MTTTERPEELDLAAVQREWTAFIDSEASKEEGTIQEFLECHPYLVPGARTVDTRSGHDPWPHAIVTQPKLPGMSDKYPDFMWIAADSAFLYPVLIEIETPWKVWFQQQAVKQHSQLTTGRDQIVAWKRWFAKPANQVAFYEMCRVPRDLQDLTMSPRYVLIHGRRAEANRSPEYTKSRGQLQQHDERYMTFDRLEPEPGAIDYLTVTLDEHGFVLLHLPQHVRGDDIPSDVIANVEGLREALSARGQSVPEDTRGPGYRFRPPPPKSTRLRKQATDS
jgi:hypothetical protein